MTISQMKLETHHRGRKIVVRVLTPPDRMTAVMAIVEDENGVAVLLQLYNQPDETVMPKGSILREGGFVLIKEPFFKAAVTDGSYSIRVDHVSDVIFLDEASEWVPKKWRKRDEGSASSTPSREIRLQGNEAVEKKEWAMAEKLYSASIQAAQTKDHDELAHLNRSLANLRLGRPASALSDAELGDKDKGVEPKEKVLFRKASALYELHKFGSCLEVLQSLNTAFPFNTSAVPLIVRAKKRLLEQETGEYNFHRMYKQARNTPPLVDCAIYSGPVETKPSPGRGRGLFTTRQILAGELLISTKRMTVGGQADLLTQLVQKLYHDSEAARSFAKLYHGDYETASYSEVDGQPVVDSFLVERVIGLTGFSCPRTTRGNLYDVDRPDAFHTCGVLPIISHTNHTCINNCYRSFIGDMQIVRATKDLELGTELLFCYKTTVDFHTYGEAQQQLKPWGFLCRCGLCLARKETTGVVLNERKVLWNKLPDLLSGLMPPGSKLRPANAKKARKLLQQSETTYSAGVREPGAVRLELWAQYMRFGRALIQYGDYSEAIEMIVKGLEAYGFIITACPSCPISKGHKEPAEFHVQQWGVVEESLVMAFLDLFQAYKVVAPELCVVTKKYAETAYGILEGEKDTFLETHPQFA